MMYNLRYHIASLVGVFLALALGLVLGGLVVQRGTIDRQQGSLVEGLQEEFAGLRDDNAALTVDNERLSELSAALTDEWISDRLVGKNIVVLSGSGRTDGLQAVIDSIQTAGGTPVTITFATPGLELDTDTIRSLFGGQVPESSEITQSIVASLAAEWAGPTTERPVTTALVDAGALSVDGLEPGMATVGLVNIAAADGKPDPTALALSLAYAGEDTIVVGAESPSLKTGVAAAIAQRNLSGVDTLGTSMGRYSIVALLSGARPGFYGQSDEAVAAFPPLRD